MMPFLVPPKDKHVDAEVARRLAQRLAQRRGGVGDARAVQVQVHVALVRKARQRLDLSRLVDRAHLGGLRNRNHLRLHVMFVADAVIGVANHFYRELAVGSRESESACSR